MQTFNKFTRIYPPYPWHFICIPLVFLTTHGSFKINLFDNSLGQRRETLNGKHKYSFKKEFIQNQFWQKFHKRESSNLI